jgi:hypothetical protein
MVRYPLLYAGFGDCLGRAEELREADHSVAGIGLLMLAWRWVHPLPITAAELYDLIVEQTPRVSGGMTPVHPDLHDAAVQIRGDPRKWTPRDLGYVLREAADRPLGGMAIRNKGKSKRGVLWAVEDVA